MRLSLLSRTALVFCACMRSAGTSLDARISSLNSARSASTTSLSSMLSNIYERGLSPATAFSPQQVIPPID